jgi:glutathione peroxidase
MVDATRRSLLLGAAAMTLAAAPATAWDFTFTAIEEGELPLARFRGRVLLVVNTASFCGFTYQYEALEKLHASLSSKGLTVIGIPSGDFNQESKTNEEVKNFCDATFGVKFPLAGITHVTGPEAHPFYQWVKAQKSWEPNWNFNKVLIGRDGGILGCYGSSDEPGSPRITRILDTALSAKA